jgi:hypothetical protein
MISVFYASLNDLPKEFVGAFLTQRHAGFANFTKEWPLIHETAAP